MLAMLGQGSAHVDLKYSGLSLQKQERGRFLCIPRGRCPTCHLSHSELSVAVRECGRPGPSPLCLMLWEEEQCSSLM